MVTKKIKERILCPKWGKCDCNYYCPLREILVKTNFDVVVYGLCGGVRQGIVKETRVPTKLSHIQIFLNRFLIPLD